MKRLTRPWLLQPGMQETQYTLSQGFYFPVSVWKQENNFFQFHSRWFLNFNAIVSILIFYWHYLKTVSDKQKVNVPKLQVRNSWSGFGQNIRVSVSKSDARSNCLIRLFFSTAYNWGRTTMTCFVSWRSYQTWIVQTGKCRCVQVSNIFHLLLACKQLQIIRFLPKMRT